MVKKLFKYEMQYYMRVLLPIYAGFAGFAILIRLMLLTENLISDDNLPILYFIVSFVAMIMFYAFIALTVVTTIFTVIRYYKNLFSGEGYLTFTLPVSPTTHLWVKLLTAFFWQLCGILVTLLSVCIVTSGDLLVELIKAAAYIYRSITAEIGSHFIFYCIEILILLAVNAFCGILLYYMCISLGQLFNKGRIGMAIAFYFGYSFVMQILSGILNVVFQIFATTETFASITEQISNYAEIFLHVFLVAMIVGTLISCIVFFLVIRYILRRRINLE